jgi:hypothetical protein
MTQNHPLKTKLPPLLIREFFLMSPQDLELEKGKVAAPIIQNIYLGMTHIDV